MNRPNLPTTPSSRRPGSVLVVEPSHTVREQLRQILEHGGAAVTACPSAEDAAGRIRHQNYDLMVSDLGALDRSRRRLPELLRVHSPGARVVLLLKRDPKDRIQAALDRCSDGILLKPLEPDHAARRLTRVLQEARLIRESHRRQETLEDKARELEATVKLLSPLATKDPLTGLNNRAQFEEHLKKEVGRARRHKLPLSLVFLDLDGFKGYNDSFGHPEGDRLLQKVAEIMAETIRGEDILCRNGGDEFSLILPMTARRDAVVVARRVVNAVSAHPFEPAGARPQYLGMSAGVAGWEEETPEPIALIEAADQALYQAKDAGKGRVRVYRRRLESAG